MPSVWDSCRVRAPGRQSLFKPWKSISIWKQHQCDINRNLSNFLKDHHELERPPLFLIQDSIQNRIIVLHEMSTISADLEQLVQSFISTRLYRTHARMRELHRTQRAFWRLLLYSDFFREPNPRYPIDKTKKYGICFHRTDSLSP